MKCEDDPSLTAPAMRWWFGQEALSEWNLAVAFTGHIPPSKLISGSCFGMESNR